VVRVLQESKVESLFGAQRNTGGADEYITDELKGGLQMFCSWVNTKDFMRTEGQHGGKRVCTGTVKVHVGRKENSKLIGLCETQSNEKEEMSSLGREMQA
jgi:hypothetical protein